MQSEQSDALETKAKKPRGTPCGAKTRNGSPCTNPGMANGRCRMHGGNQVRGLAHHAFKTGRYSKALLGLDTLRKDYEAARADVDLIALRDDLALLTARVNELLTQLPNADEVKTRSIWRQLSSLLFTKDRLVNSERKRLRDMNTIITATTWNTAMRQVESIIEAHVHDKGTLRRIGLEFQRVFGTPQANGLASYVVEGNGITQHQTIGVDYDE